MKVIVFTLDEIEIPTKCYSNFVKISISISMSISEFRIRSVTFDEIEISTKCHPIQNITI
jgi:hypothetical protein